MKKGESMKIVLAVMMTMVVANSAMAACGINSINECTTESDCKGLEKQASGKKFSFDAARSVKCMDESAGPVATNCTENVDKGRTASVEKAGDAKIDPKTGGAISK